MYVSLVTPKFGPRRRSSTYMDFELITVRVDGSVFFIPVYSSTKGEVLSIKTSIVERPPYLLPTLLCRVLRKDKILRF